MYKRLLGPAGLLVAALALQGCITTGTAPSTGTPSTGTPPASQVGQVISKIQEETVRVCGFLPAANTVNSLLKMVGVTQLDQVLLIARDICAVVTPTQGKMASRRSASPPKLRGVPVKGRFVR